MKIALPILIAVLFASCSPSKRTDMSEEGMHGSISKIYESKYEPIEKFGEVSKGRLACTNIIDVDANGNFTKEIYTSMPNPNYDTIIGYKSTKDVFVTVYKFNEKGERIAVVDGKSGQVSEKYSHDENGNLIEADQFDNNKLILRTKYLFQDGQLKQAKTYNGDGTLEKSIKLKLNDHGKIIEADEFTNEDKLRAKFINTYDDKGLIADHKVYVGNRLDKTHSYKYLTFDQHDNWTKGYYLINGKVENVVERKIEYR